MIATVSSAVLIGVRGQRVTVEVHVAGGLPGFSIVGLPDASCREARDRVRAAVLSSGLAWPPQRITVNLAPSGLRKSGAGLDVPIAVAVLAASGQLDAQRVAGVAFLGELGLDGTLRAVAGTLPLADAIGVDPLVVAPSAAAEALLVPGSRAVAAVSLRHLVAVLRGEDTWAAPAVPSPGGPPAAVPDMTDVKGQPVGRLAVEVAAAGGHHLLLCGPPGAGKTMLAERLPGLLPPLGDQAALEATRIHSAAGVPLPPGRLVRRPPFRAPHHSSSSVAMIGGGTTLMRPGEVSCAHHGVLFLDELGEFPADVLDTLRQPLEAGEVLVCRARAAVRFPARFLLVAATNPCPCGADGRPGGCRCSDRVRHRYAARISGPLLDRFDLRVSVERPDPADLFGPPGASEPTEAIAARVGDVRGLASRRGVADNAHIPGARLEELVPLARPARVLLETRLRQGRLSARGAHRVRRVARTLADLAGRTSVVDEIDVLGALALRVELFGADEVVS